MEEIKQLHPYERKVLPALEKADRYSELAIEGLQPVEVMRALQWLENKGLIKTQKATIRLVELGANGKLYQTRKLPEIRAIDWAKKHAETDVPLDKLIGGAGLDKAELGVLIGLGKKHDFMKLEAGLVKFHQAKFSQVEKHTGQAVIDKLKTPMLLSEFNEFEQHLLTELKARKAMVTISDKTDVLIKLTRLGKELLKHKAELKVDRIEKLTPELIRTGGWKGKPFRWFDVGINVPALHPGKRHFVNQAIEFIRKVWIEMGFEEMEGSLVQTAFWDLDSLFVPQDHPARTMQDTYYLKAPNKGKLPAKLAEKVKAVHETGGSTGSKGWRYKWKPQEAKQLLLRTHTTVLSAQTIASDKLKIPGKYFSVGKVFRNETLDWKHLFELNQVEGIVVGENLNLAQLKGYMKEFYLRMGYKDVRMRPGHFPYTEPSMEVEALHPNGKWIELGGSGIFRPEVTKVLIGREVPVLAWGLGMERIISQYFEITDIRELYKNDVEQLRKMKLFVR
jgi:phenylalanyl-tRNA synthetase alpha chain